VGEQMEEIPEWELDLGLMSIEQLLREWRHHSLKYYHGDPRTEYILKRISEERRLHPFEYQEADRKVGWTTE
jgi:hypothetical protein